MKARLHWLTRLRLGALAPQPLTAAIAVTLAVLVMAGAWTAALTAMEPELDAWHLVLALLLATAIVLAGYFPIHIRYHTKIELTTPQQLILAVLAPSPLAGLAAGGAMLLKGILTRAERQNTWSDILTSAGRWVVLGSACSLIAHDPALIGLGQPVVLLSTALLMFVGDILTSAFELAPMTGEPYPLLVRELFADAGLAECAQYLLGIVGVLAVRQAAWALPMLALPAAVVYYAFKTNKEMHSSTRLLLENMSDSVDMRDPYTGGHSRRVAELCGRILREMNISGVEANLILSAARVHDIGKMGLPDAILLKAGALTPAEHALLRTHAARGAELLARYPDFARGASVVRHHHERWDGRGYPDGLKDFAIPFGSRVIAVADGFDAMTSDRPYRPSLGFQRACGVLREERGRQWDPAVVDACLRALEQPVEQLRSAPTLAGWASRPVNV